MSELEQKQYRSKFISYLCQYQIKEKKVYHLNEYLKWDNDNDKYEVAFIFTLPSTNTFYKECYKIIYENINMNRATYIFYIPKDSYKIGINSIIDYFESNNINKRQELQFHRVSFAGIQYYHSVKHTDTFYDWEQYI